MKPRLSALLAMIASLLLALLAVSPASAQVTEASVQQACQASKPSTTAYGLRHTGYEFIGFDLKNPFPGRNPGDVYTEAWVTVSPSFACIGPGGAEFPVTLAVTAEVYSHDLWVCENNLTIFLYLGFPCPFTTASRFPAVADPSAAGPYPTTRIAEGPDCTIFRPSNLAADGLRHPIILWGNGTGATPLNYNGLLTHFASHGFVVAAANTPNSGTGAQMIACLDWLEGQAANPASPYYRTVNLYRVGAAGHSQGGIGVLFAGTDNRVRATAPMEPSSIASNLSAPNQHGPMLLLSGSADTTTPLSQQQTIFNLANVPVFWGTVVGGLHVPMPGDFTGASTNWFRYHLMQDEGPRSLFYGPACGLCSQPRWVVSRKSIP